MNFEGKSSMQFYQIVFGSRQVEVWAMFRDLTAEDAEVFAEERRDAPFSLSPLRKPLPPLR